METSLKEKNGFTYTIPSAVLEYNTLQHEFCPFPLGLDTKTSIKCGPFEFSNEFFSKHAECQPRNLLRIVKYDGKRFILDSRIGGIYMSANFHKNKSDDWNMFFGNLTNVFRQNHNQKSLRLWPNEVVHESRAKKLDHHMMVLQGLWIQEKSRETRRIKKEEAEKQGLSLKEFYVAAKEKKRLTKDLNRTKQWLIFGPQVLTAIEDLEAFKRSISESKDFDRKAFNRMRREIIALMTDLSKMQYLDKI